LGISSLVAGRIDLAASEHLSEEDYVTWTRRVTPNPDDVVFSYETRLGEAARIPDGLKCCLGRRMALMRPDPTRVNARFLLYAYLGPQFQETIRQRTIHGSTVDRIPLVQFPRFPICVPQLPEQNAIAAILGSLDDKIELNRRMNQTLEAMAQALFKSWFVDFDPVRAKAVGRPPTRMDAETAALFPDSLEDSVLGEIPQGWSVVPFSQQVNILSGGTPRTAVAEYWDGGIPWVSVVDTVPGPYITETEKTVSHSGVVNSAAKLLPGETVVITARGTVGNCALLAGPMSMNQSCYGLRGTNGVGQLFLFQQLRDQVGRLKASAHGSVFDTITHATFDSLDVVAPDVATLAQYESTVRTLFVRILNGQQQSKTLAAVRDALLPKLLSGEIRVKEALEAFNVVL
jgi:type I restriction enzyme S subunit